MEKQTVICNKYSHNVTWKIDKHRRNIKQSMTIPSLFQQTSLTGLVETGIGVISWNTYADD